MQRFNLKGLHEALTSECEESSPMALVTVTQNLCGDSIMTAMTPGCC